MNDYAGQAFDAAVTMGCDDACPLVRAKQRIDWQIPVPRDMGPAEFNKVRDQVQEKVRELLPTLRGHGEPEKRALTGATPLPRDNACRTGIVGETRRTAG